MEVTGIVPTFLRKPYTFNTTNPARAARLWLWKMYGRKGVHITISLHDDGIVAGVAHGLAGYPQGFAFAVRTRGL
jgi:hypothetical protein